MKRVWRPRRPLVTVRVAGAVCVVCALGALGAGCSVGASLAARTSAAVDPGRAYLGIAEPANHRLDADFDRLDGPDLSRPQAAGLDLRDIAATERAFDRSLAGLVLPPAATASRQQLIQANETRATLTEQAARSVGTAASPAAVPLLHELRQQLRAADRPVERQVTALRAELRLPPPDTH